MQIMARLCPLFSGSSGNSFYIGAKDAGILVDIGKSAKQIEHKLSFCNIPITAIQGIFITHEHTDHIAGLKVFASRYHIPVYASRGTLEALNDMQVLTGAFPCEAISPPGIACAGMQISPFPIPHDCTEGFGYRVQTSDDRTVSFSTDLGYITDTVRERVYHSDVVVLESNHDLVMLRQGRYPHYLKQRILSKLGHLSNDACAAELPRLAKSGTTRFVLAHLSQENNTPEAACRMAIASLTAAGLQQNLDYQLFVAPRENQNAQMLLF